jgi:hypothetical protein
MRNPYITYTVWPKIQWWARAAVRVMRFPRMDAVKSEHTKLKRITFSGVQTYKTTNQCGMM